MNFAKIIISDSRTMNELQSDSVHLVVTSPPYWHIKDYGVKNQIGYGQTLHEYFLSLFNVWKECFRVLKPGRKLCINIGDQFARSITYGGYKVIPLHAEIITQCEKIGFDYMGAIIWQKKTTMNTTGGATIMGSFPYPPNGVVEIDYEFILIFKKPGKSEKYPLEIKEVSKLTKEEWKEYFSGHWSFGGAKKLEHEAMFPEELPRRLIKMFSFKGDTVLDPFLGSGTTARVALELERSIVGYEIKKEFLTLIKEKLQSSKRENISIEILESDKNSEYKIQNNSEYSPAIKNANPIYLHEAEKIKKEVLYRVVEVVNENTIMLEHGIKVSFLGVKIIKKSETLEYLRKYLLGKKVFLKNHTNGKFSNDLILAYVYLKNKIFINAFLIKQGFGISDQSVEHIYKEKFLKIEKKNVKTLSHNNL